MNLDFSRLYVVTVFIRYANLFLFDSLDTQELTASLEMMYGQDSGADDSGGISILL